MILSTLYELKNPSLSGLCCGKTLLAGAVAIGLLGYVCVGAPIVGSLLQGEAIEEAAEFGIGGLCSLILSGAISFWTTLILDCATNMSWKMKMSIAVGLSASSYLTNPLWFQAPTMSLAASKIYTANGLGLAVGGVALVLAEASSCLVKACRRGISQSGVDSPLLVR